MKRVALDEFNAPLIMTLSLPLRNPVTFEPAGKVTNVFFDDKSQQVASQKQPKYVPHEVKYFFHS